MMTNSNLFFGDFTRFPKDEDMDRLKRLKFNPFSFSTDINSKTEYFLSENFECQDLQLLSTK